MQEEIEARTVTLVMSISKTSSEEIKKAMKYCLDFVNERKKGNTVLSPELKKAGKISARDLAMHSGELERIDVNDSDIRSFNKIASKYGVNYAVMKDKYSEYPRYMVFFKAPDRKAIFAAFDEYTNMKDTKAMAKESVLGKLEKFREKVNAQTHRERRREISR